MNVVSIFWLQEKIFSDRHVSLSHHACNNAGSFSYSDDTADSVDTEKADDWKSNNISSYNPTEDKIQNCEDEDSCENNAKKILAASITYKDEEILRAIGGRSLR